MFLPGGVFSPVSGHEQIVAMLIGISWMEAGEKSQIVLLLMCLGKQADVYRPSFD